ncbi:flagellar basal-body MS-ring/collar protein FliF [Orenia metallireducens]|jgi:flagellar M-ring protein FliF|nr:flagellar basal-body MS-ring/collar protein FliF [Orenia metallireducens]
MVKNLSQIREQMQNLWNNFDKKAKVVIIVSVLFTFVGMLLLANWASKPEYTVLFNNLTVKDAGGIVTKLQEKQISYKLESNGTTILVPKKQVHNLRLDLASQGLPTGGSVGFEIFDRNQLGTTDYEMKINHMRALSGELTRTIQQLDKVIYAKVQITPSKTSLYTDNEEPAKASIVVRLKEYSKLTTKEVRAIANLVASSVEGLAPEKVTIVDTSGNLLSAMLEKNEEKSDVSDKLDLKKKLEDDIERDLNVMLTKVLGVDKFSLTVNADLNFDKRNVESKRYKPVVGDEGIVRSEQTKEESSVGTTINPEGVPGTTSNIPQYRVDNQQQNQHDKEERIVNYEINEEVERYVQSPGTIERLSVAVSVDTAQEELSTEKKDAITQLISTAVGYDSNRGDQITVIGYDFNNDLDLMTQQEIEAERARKRIFLFSLLGIVGFLIILLMIMMVRKRRSQFEDDSNQAGENINYLIDEAEEEFAVSNNLTPEERERQKLQNQLRNIISEQPEEIAGLIKSWLSED